MATRPQQDSALSDSNFKMRPPTNAYYRSDANTMDNTVQQIEKARTKRQMKFPTLIGRGDVDSFKNPQNPTDTGFTKYNDESDYLRHSAMPEAPFRSCDNILDPVSGFVSVAGDVDRKTGHTHIPTMVQLNTTPQATTPQSQNLIRLNASAPPELRRQSENDPGGPYGWNSKRVSDANLRASFGGWTSARDPRLGDDSGKPHTPADENKQLRDRLADKFKYTSSTQRAYEEVPWEGMLSGTQRRWPPTTTLEKRPDMISQVFTNKRYDAAAKEWQQVGRSWDQFQTRRGYYKQNIPIPGIVFCSPCPRAQQIPNYGGCVGGVNIEEIDNANEPFTPHTVKRVNIPRYTDTSHRPNIPNYAGCSWYRPDSIPAHVGNPITPETPTTARVHRPMFSAPSDPSFKRDSQMSKMVTTVPPGNPFNKINKEPIMVQ